MTMPGAIVSWTVTSKVVVLVLPRKSLAEQDTAVEPRGNSAPAAGAQSTGRGPSTRSSAGIGPQVTGVPAGAAASTSAGGGTPRSSGAVVSVTLRVTVDVL